MSIPSTLRNLIVGLIAAKWKLAQFGQILGAIQICHTDSILGLDQVLVEQGVLCEPDRVRLAGYVDSELDPFPTDVFDLPPKKAKA